MIIRSLLLVFVGLLLSCKASAPEQEKIDIANFSKADIIGGYMNYLASDELMGRETGEEGIEMAAGLIIAEFKKNNIPPFYTSYQDTLQDYNPLAYNLVGYLEGNDPELKHEIVVIGAHYDHIGVIGIKDGDSIANGANDNASGTSTVLELARYFSKARNNKRSLVFALFSAEEKGLSGSKHLAERMKNDNINLYTVLNYEMTGVPMTDKDYLVYVTGYNKSNIGPVSNQYSEEMIVGFLPTAEKYNLFQRSDNYPFYEICKIPAHTFSTFDFTNFDHYHQVGDEPQLMNFSHMANVVNKMIPVVTGITNAKTKELVLN